MDNYSQRRKKHIFLDFIVKWQCTGMVNCINQWKNNHFSRSNHFNDNNWRYYNSFGWSYLREMESNGEEGKANGNTVYIFRNNIYLCVLCCSHTTYHSALLLRPHSSAWRMQYDISNIMSFFFFCSTISNMSILQIKHVIADIDSSKLCSYWWKPW